jgi:DNA adenine methylase
LRAFAGFGVSYGGKWFSGYARSTNKNYADQTKRGLLRDIAMMGNVNFKQGNYRELILPSKAIVYADPPYVGTTTYKHAFSSFNFWFTVRKWTAAGATVYVSEYRAPADFGVIWEYSSTGNMAARKVTEKLYMLKET